MLTVSLFCSLRGVGWETYMQLYQEHIFLHILIGTLYGSS